MKLSTRNSSIGTRRVPAAPRTTTSAREASATAGQSPDGSLWHRLPTTVPHLTHDRIGDHARHVVEEAPAALADPRRPLDVAVARDRADRQRLAAEAQVVQLGERVDVDQHGGTRQAEPHRRNQALAAGQHPGVGAVLLQVRERLVGGVSPMVIEGCRNHGANLHEEP